MITEPKTTAEFELQGKQFLEETGTTMEVGEPEFGLHFDDDKKPRYRFPVTFKRGKMRRRRITLVDGETVTRVLFGYFVHIIVTRHLCYNRGGRDFRHQQICLL